MAGMDKEPTVQTLSNVEVGRRIGLHHTSVSRVRSADRVPSLEVMSKIAAEFGWSLDDQAAAKAAGRPTYARQFELVIKAKHDREQQAEPVVAAG
jgi:ribosome-binding protein aMBF1 (putative translation factor)